MFLADSSFTSEAAATWASPTDCGGEAVLYLRAKPGSCNCVAGITDDDELHRMSDFDLVGGEAAPREPGKPIAVGPMRGRSLVYRPSGSTRGGTMISAAFNDRCDMVVATVAVPRGHPEAIEPSAMALLNSAPVLRWAEAASDLSGSPVRTPASRR